MSILIFVVCLAVLVGWLEKNWAPRSLNYLHYDGQCDTLLLEPEEAAVWTSTIENRGRWPVLFVRLWDFIPGEATLQAEESWIREHQKHGLTRTYVEDTFLLMPGKRRSSKITFVLPKRGRYEFGHRLAAGDLLGLEEVAKEQESSGAVIVLPKRVEETVALDALGGLLGDHSVRRRILEDPMMIAGFRDYTGREPMKDISWMRTAVSGRLQVRQYDYTAEQTVTVMLNTRGGSEEELERCFSLTRTVCEELERRKIPYGFQTNGDVRGPVGPLFWLASGLGTQHLNTILYGLGQAGYTNYQSLDTMVDQALGQARPSVSYLLITPSLEGQDKKALARLSAHAMVTVLEGRVV